MFIKPSISLFQNLRSGDFAVLKFTIEKEYGMRAGSGKLAHIPFGQMNESGLQIVMESLKEFGKGEAGCELEALTPSQRSKFHRQHKSVGIWLDSPTCLVLQAMRRVRGGGGVGKPEGRIVLDVPCANDAFLAALRQAFEISD